MPHLALSIAFRSVCALFQAVSTCTVGGIRDPAGGTSPSARAGEEEGAEGEALEKREEERRVGTPNKFGVGAPGRKPCTEIREERSATAVVNFIAREFLREYKSKGIEGRSVEGVWEIL